MALDPNIILSQKLARPVTAMQQGQQFEQKNRLGELQIQDAENKLAQKPQLTKEQMGLAVKIATNLHDDAIQVPEGPERDAFLQNALPMADQTMASYGVPVTQPLTWDTAKMIRDKAAGGVEAKNKFQAVPTQSGFRTFDKTTGLYTTPKGESMMPPQYDPSLKRELARSGKIGGIEGAAVGDAAVGVGSAVAQGEQAINLLDGILSHPGLKQAVGKSSVFGVQHIPGTDAKDFMVRLEQMKGKQFMEAYQGLKGGGQITEIEGTKAEAAIARMDNAQSEEAFIEAVKEFQDIIRGGIKRAKAEAKGDFSWKEAPSVKKGTVENGYVFLGGDPASPKSWKKQ